MGVGQVPSFSFSLPEVQAPKLDVPKLEAPKFEAPKFEAPKFELPKFEAPKFALPKPEPPKVRVNLTTLSLLDRMRLILQLNKSDGGSCLSRALTPLSLIALSLPPGAHPPTPARSQKLNSLRSAGFLSLHASI